MCRTDLRLISPKLTRPRGATWRRIHAGLRKSCMPLEDDESSSILSLTAASSAKSGGPDTTPVKVMKPEPKVTAPGFTSASCTAGLTTLTMRRRSGCSCRCPLHQFHACRQFGNPYLLFSRTNQMQCAARLQRKARPESAVGCVRKEVPVPIHIIYVPSEGDLRSPGFNTPPALLLPVSSARLCSGLISNYVNYW